MKPTVIEQFHPRINLSGALVCSLSLFRTAVRPGSSTVGLSGIMTALIALMPKCPICWMALMSAFGLSWVISPSWSRPLVFGFLLVPVGLLTLSAHRARRYGPFFVGAVAAIVMYLCKFQFNYETGVYLGGIALFGASLWSVRLMRQARSDTECQC